MKLTEVLPDDVDALTAFLTTADLTTAGLGDGLRLWVERDETGAIVGSTGYERVGRHALIRSVAVGAAQRSGGRGTALAGHALQQAADEGARRAWLFSRRSGPFWQRLGFVPGDREVLARVLADTHQVRLFAQTGQLGQEIAWTRALSMPGARAPVATVSR